MVERPMQQKAIRQLQIRPEESHNPAGVLAPWLVSKQAHILNSLKVGILVFDLDGTIAQHNRAITRLLGLAEAETVGKKIQDTGLLQIIPELGSQLQGALSGNRSTHFRARARAGDEDRLLEVALEPMFDEVGRLIGTFLCCEDSSVQEQFEKTVEALQSTSSDLESANEELQVTNEELEATNDELQSTNEELATTNEELQALNEELQTTNLELADRTKQVDQLNNVYAQTLERLGLPVMLVNQDGGIEVWNSMAGRLFDSNGEETRLQIEQLPWPRSLHTLIVRKYRELLKKRRAAVVPKVAFKALPNAVDLHFNVIAPGNVLITFEPARKKTRESAARTKRSKKVTC